MGITELRFILFLCGALILYYIIPNKHKWTVLLIASIVFVFTYNPMGFVFILCSSFCIWFAGIRMHGVDLKYVSDKKLAQKHKKRLLVVCIAINLAILIVLKYLGSSLGMHTGRENPFAILIPIGLSYYTLQAIGYILDVYWGKISFEHSYAKLLLFLCYFPQMLQGPISRYKDLSFEFYEKEKDFSLHNIKFGSQLMLWGYLKIMISSNFGENVSAAFYGSAQAYGLSVFLGFILFGIELYCNFSGGIDVVRGVSECFGIALPENFTQPFFSKSLSEFWRRWHITLGSWMKDYVFFPFSMSKSVSKAKKKLKLHVSRKMANRIPIAVGNIVVFLLVGIWHGTGTNYALWGLYNGVILAFSELMTDIYAKVKDKAHIRTQSWYWHTFCVLRTFVIVTLGWCTDCASTAGGSLDLLKRMCMLSQTNLSVLDISPISLMQRAFLITILIAVSILHENHYSVRKMVEKRHYLIQCIFWAIVLQIIICLSPNNFGGLMYANF